MRKVMFLVLALLPIGAEARPDTHALLAKQSDGVTLKKIGAHTYRVEICPTNGCDAFESSSSPLLDDYVYLYSVYVGRFPDFAASAQDDELHPMAFITEAEKKGYARQVLDVYSAKYGCGKPDQMCVLKRLRKEGAIKHYDVNYDEGQRTQTLVSGEDP